MEGSVCRRYSDVRVLCDAVDLPVLGAVGNHSGRRVVWCDQLSQLREPPLTHARF